MSPNGTASGGAGGLAWPGAHSATDSWAGPRNSQDHRLRLIAHNTCFLLLPAARNCPQLRAHVLGANPQRLSAGWQAKWGHPLELAQSCVNPSWGESAVCQATHWLELSRSRG